MHITTVCLHPEMVLNAFKGGVCGRAMEAGVASLRCVNPRDFAAGPHRSVDDRPYGGGPGMVLSPEPLLAAVRTARAEAPGGAPVIFLTPQGRGALPSGARGNWRPGPAWCWSQGATRGIDERVVELEADEELSLGRFRPERRRTGRLRGH